MFRLGETPDQTADGGRVASEEKLAFLGRLDRCTDLRWRGKLNP
jgi:hypothetical protein